MMDLGQNADSTLIMVWIARSYRPLPFVLRMRFREDIGFRAAQRLANRIKKARAINRHEITDVRIERIEGNILGVSTKRKRHATEIGIYIKVEFTLSGWARFLYVI